MIAFVVFVTVLVLAVMGTVQQSFLVVTNAVATVNDRWLVVILSAGDQTVTCHWHFAAPGKVY